MDNGKKHVFESAGDSELEEIRESDIEPETDESTPSENRTDFPCSVAQERFWLLDRLEPGNSSLNVAVRWRLEGQVSTALLEQAWLKIIERHEILRTVFLEVDSVAVQRTLPLSLFKLAEIDLSNLPEDQQQIEGDRIGVIEARAPFDLLTGPLVRATLLRFSPTVAVILVTTHQIVSDGWSIGVMAREMGLIYQALSRNEPVALEELPLQYADYSMWQLEWLRVRGTDAETAYWTRQLANVKPFKVLPDRPRPAVPTTNGAIVSIVLPRELTNRAQVLSGERGATLFATALAALTATLSRYTGEDQVVVGTQVSDRDQVELEGMIGQFVNSLILRNDLAGDPPFTELIERIRDTVGQALEHRHIPIERLLSMVKGERSGVHSALISVNFIFQRTFIQNVDYGDFRLIDMPSLPAGAIYDLNFFMVERPDGWRFSCQYNTDQFEPETAPRLLRYVQRVLENVVEQPESRISALKLLDSDERGRLLHTLNDTDKPYPDSTLPRLFEAQAALTPDALAVVSGERRLSYRQLDAEANRLAQHLVQQGAGVGLRIGVCLRRSADWVVALLAISKTGAAYVALDPSDPPAYLERQVQLADLRVIVAATAHKEGLHGLKARLVDLDADKAAISHAPATAPGVTIHPDSEVFTSFVYGTGSELDGVRVSHHALIVRLSALRERPGLSADDVLVAVSPQAQDLATMELFLPLLAGARVVIADDKDTQDGRRLLQLLQRCEATVMHAPPSIWSSLIAADWQGLPRLKILCACESHDRRLIAQLLDRSSELWRLYARPETVLAIAAHRVTSQEDQMLIGAPLANTKLYVLDGYRGLQPTGAPGTLYVGGEGLALGGLIPGGAIDAAYTADPFTPGSRARLYRSPDQARVRKSGLIEHLGRSDQRVKLNGYWIETGIIESVLRRHASVADIAVLLPSGPQKNGGITAFVTLQPSAQDQFETIKTGLRVLLAESLPRYLQTIQIVQLQAVPRTASGAIDVRALLRLGSEETTPHGKPAVQPISRVERHLQKIWCAMLKLDEIDLNANFFELGGHSLLAARMLARVQTEFGRRISLASLFRAPSIRELAHLLEEDEARDFDFRQVVKLQAVGSRPPLIGINNTGIYYMLAKRLGPEQPFTSLQLFDPSARSDEMPKTLEEIAAGYVQLIRRVQPKGPYQLMGWCVAGALAFEIACQLDAAHQEVQQLYLMDAWVPGYQRRLPKLRALISDYSLRWQFIVADWRRLRAKQLGFGAFLENRALTKKLRKLFRRPNPADFVLSTTHATVSPEDYDQWLLAYLQRVTACYEPKQYRGKITLFRSHGEPTGWWFDPKAGWEPYADGGVDLQLVDGDHFTMFQEPGVSQTAEKIAAAVTAGNA